MALTLDDLDLDALLRPILVSHAATVAAWQRNEPGSWGALAAQAILATRRALGRPLTEEERRVVWAAMWQVLATPPRRCGGTPPPEGRGGDSGNERG